MSCTLLPGACVFVVFVVHVYIPRKSVVRLELRPDIPFFLSFFFFLNFFLFFFHSFEAASLDTWNERKVCASSFHGLDYRDSGGKKP